jgi:hypothetical protein
MLPHFDKTRSGKEKKEKKGGKNRPHLTPQKDVVLPSLVRARTGETHGSELENGDSP